MTVSSSTNQATFPGNGVTTVFPLPFRFFENSDISVSLIDIATGVSTPLVLGVHYTLFGAAEPEVDGNAVSQLTMATAPSVGQSLYVLRSMEIDQPTDIVNQARFFPQIHENVFDRLTMLIQQVSSGLRGAIRVAIGDPEPKRLPPVSQRANLLMGFDSAGDPIAVAPASGSAAELAMNLANDTDPSKGAAMLGYKGRTVFERLSERVSVKDAIGPIPGAVGDGVADDTAAIQAAIDAVEAAGGGVVHFPAGRYLISAGLQVSISGVSSRFNGRIHLVGESSTSTVIIAPGAITAINVVGSLQSFETYFGLIGIRVTGSARTAGSIGLRMTNSVAYPVLSDAIIEDFEYGWVAQDTEQVGVYDSFIRWNTYGILALPAAVTTSPNSWSFYNSVLAGNYVWGMQGTNVNALNWNGGSVQYNGYIGDGAAAWGIKIIESGDGYGTVGFTNMIFEGNGGLGDFVSVQTTNSCAVNMTNVSFVRTVNFASATVTGAANNGSGAIRLTLNSTAPLVGRSAVMITGVVGTTEANRADPWPFTIIDGTHIDLTGSTFTNAYVSGGIATILGFGRNCILASGSNANSTYTITGCTFKSSVSYLPSALRPTIALDNTSAKIRDDGTNVFQHAIEKLTYIQTQQIGDDGSSWVTTPTVVSAAGGTFSATGTLRIKKIGKTVHFSLDALTTSYAATPTAPVSFTVPFPAASRCTFAAVNGSTLSSLSTVILASATSVGVWGQAGVFPVTANSQRIIVNGSYETTA